MNWTEWLFPFPDEGGPLIRAIMTSIYATDHFIPEPQPLPAFVLKVENAAALIYLRFALAEERLESEDGISMFGPDELLIAADDRLECEALLREACPSRVTWRSLVLVRTCTPEAFAAFRDHYDHLMGLGGWLSYPPAFGASHITPSQI